MPNELLLDSLCRTAKAISVMFGHNCETVVHDFSNADCRIVALNNGHVSGRTLGSTDTIYGLTISSADCKELIPTTDYVNTMVITRDGRRIKTTSINYIGDDYHYVLGINFDSTAFAAAGSVISDLISAESSFRATDIADKKLADAFDHCVSCIGKPVERLNKAERRTVVGMLNDNGMLSVQKAVPYVSERLGVSRFTIYNYLNELKGKTPNGGI